jgi:hypothetical protein
VLAMWTSGLEALVLVLGETLLVLVLVVARPRCCGACAACVVNASIDIVAVIASSVRPVARVLVGKTSQFAFAVHVLQRLMSLWR